MTSNSDWLSALSWPMGNDDDTALHTGDTSLAPGWYMTNSDDDIGITSEFVQDGDVRGFSNEASSTPHQMGGSALDCPSTLLPLSPTKQVIRLHDELKPQFWTSSTANTGATGDTANEGLSHPVRPEGRRFVETSRPLSDWGGFDNVSSYPDNMFINDSHAAPSPEKIRFNSRDERDLAQPLESFNSEDSQIMQSLENTSSTTSRVLDLSDICTVQLTDNRHAFVFHCTSLKCRKRNFTRWYDFHRHYNGAHALEKTVFWCPVLGCGRSERNGNHGLPRKDKMVDHVSKIHSPAARSQL